jgi:hypothetical protein
MGDLVEIAQGLQNQISKFEDVVNQYLRAIHALQIIEFKYM